MSFPYPPGTTISQSPPPPAPPSNGNYSMIAGLTIAFGIVTFVLSYACRLFRQDHAGAEATEAAADLGAARSGATTYTVPPEPWDDGDEQRRRRVSPTAGLPSFTYDRSVMHNVTSRGEEAATCSVCLGAFQTGETVRLLPVCLHLYHAECIDPWLDAHSTCPICRSGTDPVTAGRLHLPV
ncbi:hypothetical protein PAHAL_4G121600 [Panicum hallii]|jgi:hypothetical protein|uniref:RING-type E3 ubiquitin transferase n=1 Tax=Panicum hallii TaxID=206008 RepID=A0A2S3HIU8_9POAL|nr:RING-H2 finger protein ATL39-like [Panicum hallii]PAN23830.1 hypothetical protein PAHAL_4G121600 [Panicum hallii]